MAVTIDIELRAGDAEAEILGIAGAMETLERAAGDLDLDFDDLDIDEISGEIGNLVNRLENLDVDLSSLEENLTRIENLDDVEIEHIHHSPDGATGDGDSTGNDPPGERPQRITVKGGDLPDFSEATADGGSAGPNLNEQQLARKIESVGGFDRGSVSISGNFKPEELNEIASDIEHTTKGLTSDKYPWLDGDAGDGNLGANQMPGNFHDQPDPAEMDWNEIQRRASEAGVYTQDADRNTLESRLRSQQFGGKGINVDTESHGTVGLRQARRIKQGAYDFPNSKSPIDFDKAGAMQFARDESSIPDTDLREAITPGQLNLEGFLSRRDDGSTFGNIVGRVTDIDSKAGIFDAMGDGADSLGGKLRKLKPTMGKYMQLMAALLPVAVALGTQLLGVAAAMGSVAAAGGAIMGLGLLGHGESMAGSMAEAKQQMRSLKKEMFQVAQPTMQQFAPIQSRMFDSMPEGLESVFEEMEGFTAFEDTLFELGGALAGGMEEAIAIINENEQAISQLTTRFGGLIGSGLLKFFEWLIQAASKNQDLLIGLGKDMLKLAVAAYNVSMAVAKVLTAFTPLFNLLVFISEVLNSEIIIGLIAMVGWLFVLGKAAGMIYALYAGFMTLASGIADAALMMFGYEMSTWGAVAATLALVAAIGLLTLGAATVIGGAVTAGAMGAADTPAGPGGVGGGGPGGRGGGKTVYNDNRSYEINNGGGDDYASQKAMEDTVTRVNETNEAQSLPDVETSSESSDGNSTSQNNN